MTMDKVLRPLARRLVNSFGKSITLRRGSVGVYNPVAGTLAGQKTNDFPTKGVVRTLSETHTKNTRVEAGDMEITVAADGLGIVPDESTDVVVMDGDTWSLVAVEPIFSGQLAALYNLVVRK